MHIGNVFDNCKNLYSLNLAENPELQDVDVYDLLQRLPGLSYLCLSFTGVKIPDQVPQLDSSIDFELTHLSLDGNQLANEDLLNYLLPFKNLKTLDLQKNKLTKLNIIDNIRSAFPRLSTINLCNNSMDFAWVEEATAALEAQGINLISGTNNCRRIC